MRHAYAVIGANFGDEGKGLMVDYLANKYQVNTVVLSNGGAQRGHTVVTPEGYRHVFHHFGSNSFLPNSKTYIPEYFVVNPVIFRQEHEKLAKHGIHPVVHIHPDCLLTTIFDMLINQAIEIDRAKDKHGSCGIGLYETLYRNHTGVDFKATQTISPLGMTVKEFYGMSYISKVNFLLYLRSWYVNNRLNELKLKKDLNKTFQNVLTNDNVIINYLNDFDYMMSNSFIADYSVLDKEDSIIFENGQGLLLDQHNMDYFPHLTPSNTGVKNCANILDKINYTGQLEAIYVTRTYMTRHGVGRFDTECKKSDINAGMLDMTNVPNPFQDSLRYGFLNWNEFVTRANKDAATGSVTKNDIFIYPLFAVTHLNEFDAKIPEGNAHYMSYGLTRNNVVTSLE